METRERKTKTILVVDDSNTLRNQVAELLQKYGYMTLEAGNGLEGLKILAGESRVDLVILDMVMPIMDGKTMIMEARAYEKLRDIPILILTAAKNVNMISSCMDAGGNDFLIKPVNPRLLYQRVQSLVEANPRAYNRIQCNVYAEASTGTENYSGELREIGEGGAGLLLNSLIDTGDIIKVSFTLPRQEDQLTLGGEVIYVQDAEGGKLHGLRFIIIDGDTRNKIMQYVQSVVSEDS